METRFIKRSFVIMDAGDIAQQRLYDYLDEKLKGETDTAKWTFFNSLLKQAKKQEINRSGHINLYKKDEQLEFQKDKAEIENYWDKNRSIEKQEERGSIRR